MPLQNRVTPLGELVATPHRGLVYGNRGCLHDADGRIVRSHATRRWISCRLAFKGWHRSPLLQPGRFTELFFLDEATAFAAGHRPCALCRREDYNRFCEIAGVAAADDLDLRLHSERLDHRRRRLHRRPVADLPDGTFVIHDDVPHLLRGGELRRWTPGGYANASAAPQDALVLTPPTLTRVLASGWAGVVPLLHPSAASVEQQLHADHEQAEQRADDDLDDDLASFEVRAGGRDALDRDDHDRGAPDPRVDRRRQ